MVGLGSIGESYQSYYIVILLNTLRANWDEYFSMIIIRFFKEAQTTKKKKMQNQNSGTRDHKAMHEILK